MVNIFETLDNNKVIKLDKKIEKINELLLLK